MQNLTLNTNTKKEIYLLREEISALKNEMVIKEVRISSKLAETKTDMIKWVFTFFATLTVMIIGLYLKK